MLRGLKQQWRDLRKGRPGRRFQDQCERKRSGQEGKSWMRRFLQPVIGTIVLAAGIVFCVIPGPGLPLVLVGATLLAEHSQPMARGLDWCEVKLRNALRWGKSWWHQASVVARNALVVTAAFVIAGAGYGAYHFIFGG